ncbi:hypothetical protein CH330_00960 [candidate division WOR-3 bacterium JGI_Cruoil_03_51_56]|uniref:Helicase HerA central domain-containing protein n=1 Tax=candidate division WOR-3 bacterium JGI_Cruoil_03_51_56 TaxID=1973747 RepID=A0A235BXJ9_UNCW3|nr:MAG: hypothetical protein CH330_02350 [candidate division WOR-3 bacterium JGI_Cruoil_03_51_56]OYD17073.1 MAG: hypothetical protein CH330_00960 [candidate division WOR-3 bacterium JGI_Cruoil_03_51_56]
MKELIDKEIGRVVEVNGERALVELTVDTTVPLVGDYYPGQPGSHVKIPFGGHNVIGIVTSVREEGYPSGSGRKDSGRKVADCVLIGTLFSGGNFVRGVAVYPNIGQQVRMVSSVELKKIFSEFVDYDYSFGRPAQAEDQRAYVQADRFFGHHIAVLGTTGCGKTCTVVSILQQAIKKYPDTHIIVLDLHGEYAPAFSEEKVLVIRADELELPYWLLNFNEFCDLAVDPNELTSKNQITVLRDALVRARQGCVSEETAGIIKSITVDSPIYFPLDDLVKQIRNWNIQMVSDSNGKIVPGPLYGVFDRFLIRFESKATDPRFRFMFAPTSYTDNKSLPKLLKDYLSIDTGKRMAIIDLSGIPSEVVGVVVAVVSRVAFEFNQWNPDRTRFPILLVYEEAHNYVPRRTDGVPLAAKSAVERVTKEGRKYGIGTIIVSQRPNELSETVLSQCNTFIAMRLTNPDDQSYVRRLVPDSLARLMNMLPALRIGEALILGDSVAMPTRVLIDCPDPKPMSSDVEFAKWWANGVKELDVKRVVKRWRARQRDL